MPRQPVSIKKAVIERANGRCEYCKSPADFSPQPFSIEHIHPVCAGGQSNLANLAYSCQGCNNHKYVKTEGFDSLHDVKTPLFHPRQDDWFTHFGWVNGGLEMVGLTATGRATIKELHLNRKNLLNFRSLLLLADLHPPVD